MAMGAVRYPPREVVAALLNWLPGSWHPRPSSEDALAILLLVRLPRVLLAAVVGLALSSAGASLQGLLGNPLADPYIVGVSSGSALGALGAVVLGGETALGGMGVPLAAFATGILAMGLVLALGRSGGKVATRSFLLAGVVVGSLFWAGVTLLLVLNPDEQQRSLLWLAGGLSEGDLRHVLIAAPICLASFLLLCAQGRALNLLSMGEETAQQMGVSVERVKLIVLGATTLATAAATSVAGIIGFVGLIVPHLVRGVLGPDHRVLIPVAGVVGAAFLVLTDTAARSLFAPVEIPVGVFTALMGGPLFLSILRRKGP
jgi:iron complex transport system permease protein